MSDFSLENIIEFDEYPFSDDPTIDTPDPITDPTPDPDPITDSEPPEPADPIDVSDPEPADDEYKDLNIYAQHYHILKASGLIDSQEDVNIEDADSLVEVIEKAKSNIFEQTANSMWEALPDDFKPLLEYALAGGNDLKKFLSTAEQKLNYEEIDLSTAENQKAVIREFYKKTTNYSDDRINKLIDKAALTDSLYEDAEESLNELKEISAAELAKLAQEQAAQQEAQRIKEEQMRKVFADTIEKVEFIPKDRKGKVKGYLLNVQVYDGEPDTQFNRTLKMISANPEHLVQLADVLMSYDEKKGLTLDRITKIESTKATKSLKDKLQSITQTSPAGKGAHQKPSNAFSWDEFLKQN